MAAYRQFLKPLSPGRLSLNSFWLLVARVASQALTVLFTLAIARSLGEADFGRFAFISAIVFIGNVFSTFGLDTLIIREVAMTRAAADEKISQMIYAALALQLLLSLLYIALAWSLGWRFTAEPSGAAALRVAVLALIPLAFSTIYSAVLRGHEKMAAYMAFSVITAAASGLGALILYWRGGSLLGAAWIVLIAQTTGAVAAFGLARRTIPQLPPRRSRPDRTMLARVGRGGAMLAALMVLAVFYQRLGVILLSLLEGDAATGLYSAAAKVLEVLKMLPGAVFGALLPMMAAGPRATTRRSYRQAVTMLLGAGIVLAVLTAVFAEPLIILLFGTDFAAAVTPLRVMAASLPLTVLAFTLSFDLIVQKKERIAVLATLLALLIAGVITSGLISRWSLTGAAVALPLCEAAQVAILGVMTAVDHFKAAA